MAQPNWSQKVATPASFGTPEAAAAKAPAPGNKPNWSQQVEPGVSWSTLTGQNMEGTNNAFDTDFWNTATRQDEEQRTRGMGDRWTRKDATGVVVYNDESRGLRFGDVFLNGQKQGNLRDGYAGLDREQSNQMLARMVLPREVWAKAYESESGKPLTFAGNVDEEIAKVERTNTDNYAKGLSASEFQAGVLRRTDEIADSGLAQAGVVGTGVAGGALIGAGVGALFGGVGAAPGAVIGGLIGGVGSWFNRDQRYTELAQAMEQYELATKDGHQMVGIADAFSGYASFASSSLNPTRNVLHGAYDAIEGDVGDNVSSYYNAERSGMGDIGMTILDTAALLVDGIGSFGTGAARLAFTATMGASAVGSTSSVGFGIAEGNIAFNPYSGAYEDIGAAGMAQQGASAGIDVAQTFLGKLTSNVLRTPAQRAAGGVESQGGYRIGVDAAGQRTTVGIGGSMLIPSEAAVGMSARMYARRSLNNQGMEATRENLGRETARYIDNLTTGRKTLATAMVNGFGEGAEELVQAALGATAFGEVPTFRDLFEAARQGFGMGFGMGTAIGRGTQTTSARYREQSIAMREYRGEAQLDDAQWNKLTLDEQAREGQPRNAGEQAGKDAVLLEAQRQGLRVTAANIPELQRAVQVAATAAEKDVSNTQSTTEPARQQHFSNLQWGAQDYVVSLNAALSDVRQRGKLMVQVAQGEEIRSRSGNVLSPSPEERAAAERIAASDAQLVTMLEQARAMIDADPTRTREVLTQVNAQLKAMWTAQGEEAYGPRRSASVWGARFPLNAAGSFQLLRLQLSPELTEQGTDSAVLVPDEILAPTGGDFDGDKFINLIRQLLPDDAYDALRRGSGQLTSEGTMIATQPYTEAAVEMLYDAMARPGTSSFDAATETARRIRTEVSAVLRQTSIPKREITRRVTKLSAGLTNRQPKAIAQFLNALAAERSAEMRELAEKLDGSPWLVLNRAVTVALADFQTTGSLTTEAMSAGGTVALPAVSAAMPRYRTATVRQSSALLQGATEANKYDIFRLQTVLKYNARREATETQEQERTGELADLIRDFTMRNDGLGQVGEDAIFEGTAVQERTIAWLRDIGRTYQQAFGTHTVNEAVVLLAGTPVPDVDVAARAPRSAGNVLLLQALLHESVAGMRRTYADVLNGNDALSSRLASLDALTRPDSTDAQGGRHAAGGDAFVEVLGAMPIYELLGDQGAAINTWTVRGLRDHLMSLRADVRREFEERLKDHPSYAADRDVAEGANPLSPYRVLVDNVMESARQQLHETDGLAAGARARSSQTASANFAAMHDSLRKLANARGAAFDSPRAARAFLADNPALAERVLALVESAGVQAGAVQREVDGSLSTVEFPQWIYDVLAEPSTARAEMGLLRGTLQFGYAQLGSDGTERLDALKVNDRIQRLRLHLDFAANDLTSPTMTQDREARDHFMELLLDETQTVDSFMRALNTDFRFRDETSAPFMPWARDRSIVEASRFGSGISEVMEGTEMRDALRDASLAAAAELRNTEAIATYLERNAEMLDKLREARNNPRSVNRGAWDNFVRWTETARELPTVIGASVWIQQASHINEILGHMGVKGISPDNVAPLGKALAAQLPTFDAAVGQLFGSATSGSLDGVLTDMTQLARTNRTIVLDDGTVVNWSAVSPEQALDLLSDPSTAGLAARMLGMTAWDYNEETGANSLVSILGEGIAGFIGDPATSLFGNSTSSRLRRLQILESQATTLGGPPIIPVILAQQMNVREAAVGHVIDPRSPERHTMAMEILEDLADVLQKLSTIEGMYVDQSTVMTLVDDDSTGSDEHPVGTGLPVTLVHQAILRAGRTARAGTGNMVSKMLAASGPLRDVGHEIVRQWSVQFSRSAVASGNEALMAAARKVVKDLNTVDDYTSPLDVLISTYENYDDPMVRELLLRHAAAHGDITRAVPWAAQEIQRALNPNTPTVTIPAAPGVELTQPDLTSKQWGLVARGVIAFTMHTTYGITASSDMEVSVFPDLRDPEAMSAQRAFWDPSYVDLTTGFLAEGIMSDVGAPLHPLLVAQLNLVRKMAPQLPTTTSYQAEKAVEKFVAPKRTNADTGVTSGTTSQWHALIPALMHSAAGAVMASATESAISMAGLNPSRLRMLSATTIADWTQRPGEDSLSSTSIPADQLVQSVTKGDELDSQIAVAFPGGAAGQRPLAQLEGRVVRTLVLTLPGGEQVSLLANPRWSTGLLLPPQANVRPGEAGVVTLSTLSEAVATALQEAGVPRNQWERANVDVTFWHPESKAAATGQTYSHSPWFDGVNGRTDAAFAQPSLLGGFFFGLDGTVPAAYERSLGAIKKLTFALQQVTLMPEAARRAMIAQGTTDMAGTLRRLTDFVLKQQIDGEPLGATKYNAVHKLLSLLYVVRVIDENGQPTVLSAEEVIARQAAGEVFAPEQMAEVVGLPMQHLLTLMGEETSAIVVTPSGDLDHTPDVAAARQYTGFPANAWTTDMFDGLVRLDESGTGWATADLLDNEKLRNLSLPKSRVMAKSGQAAGNGRDFFSGFRKLQQAIQSARAGQANPSGTRWSEQRQTVQNRMASNPNIMGTVLNAVQLAGVGGHVASAAMLAPARPAEGTNDTSTAFEYVHRGARAGSAVEGVLYSENIGEANAASPGLGDQVYIPAGTFLQSASVQTAEEIFPEAREVLSRLMGTGSTIILPVAPGAEELRARMLGYLREHSYSPTEEGGDTFVPQPTAARTQAIAAFRSTLNGATHRTSQNRVPLSLSAHNLVNENSIISFNGGLGGLEDYFVREVGQTARYAGYAPTEAPADRVRMVNALLPVLRSESGREYLRTMSDLPTDAVERAEAERDFDAALERLTTRLVAAAGDPSASLLPSQGEEFGTGDLIPLGSFNGRGELVGIHLLRHGHEPVDEQLIAGGAYPDGNEELGVAGARLTIDKARVDAGHTTHQGILVERKWLGLQGFVARVRVELSDLGSKVFETMTGMKWTTTPASEQQVQQMPTVPLFAGRPILGAGDLASPTAKTSDGWWLNTPSHIVESVGFDTTPYLVRALTGVSFDETNPDVYAAASVQVVEALRAFTRRNGGSIAAHELVERNTRGFQTAVVDALQAEIAELLPDSGLVFGAPAELQAEADATFVRLTLSALAAGADLAEVLGAPGYLNGSTSSHTMHPVFTTLLHQLPVDHPARAAFVDQINLRMPRGKNGVDGFTLNPDFTWTRVVEMPDGRFFEVPDMLAFAEVRNTGHNDALSDQGLARKQRGSASTTTSAMAFSTYGVRSILERAAKSVPAMFGPNQYVHDEMGQRALAFNRGTTNSPHRVREDGDLPLNAAEQQHVFTEALPARRALAVPIDQSGWYEGLSKEKAAAAKRQYQAAFSDVLRKLHLSPTQATFLTEMIRSVVARPAGIVERGEGEFLTRSEAMAALKLIATNVANKDLPTHGGAVSIPTRAALLALREGGYPLRRGNGQRRPVSKWDDWVDVMLAEAFSDDPQMRGYVAVSNMVDGVLYEYRKDIAGLPVTVSNPLNAELHIAQTRNGLMVASPVLRSEFDAPGVVQGERVHTTAELRSGDWALAELPQDARALVEKRMASWEARNGLKGRMRQSPRKEAIRGAVVRKDLADTNVVMRYAQIWYVLKSLINPGLYISAFLEVAQRGAQENITSLLSGENLRSQRFTPQQQKKWLDTKNRLADNASFYESIYANTNYQQAGASSSLERRLQKFTTAATAAVNDPTWGIRAGTISKRFMEAAWSAVEKMPLEQQVSVEQFLNMLAGPDPIAALSRISPDAVELGYERIKYARGLQDNLMERTRRAFVEGIIARGGPGTNTLGVLLLRLPTLFFRFRSNTIINMLGLQAPHAILSTVLSDRKKRPGGLLDAVRGEDGGEDAEITDYAKIEDSMDLTRAIIRSGVSHTQLFMLGSMVSAAGFGGGDDDEEKLLNKLRRYQQEPVAQDPLALENDFRNAEAWFSDLLPAGMTVPSWVTKLFVSPAMGVARFKETGDFRQVLWGFMDTLGSLPLLNVDTVLNSWDMATELAAAAEAETQDESIEATSRASRLLFTSMATLESMMFESAFASMIYQGADEWDRDPYKKPLLDSSGTAQVEGAYGTPRETDVLQDYIDPVTGEAKQGYVNRTEKDAMLHSLGERRPFFATVMSLIMQDSTYWRYNQPVKTREIKTEELDQTEATALVLSILDAETGSEHVTALGAEGIVRGLHLGTIGLDSPALQGVFIPNEMREQIQTQFLAEMTTKHINAGYSKKEALAAAKKEFYGQGFDEPEALGLADILWTSDAIPRYQNQKYMQLNTTYVTGPNGRPVATGLTRNVLSAFGLDIVPGQTYHDGTTGNLGVDQLLNSVDAARGVNLGMRGLTKVDETWYTPTAEEIGASIDDALARIGEQLESITDALGQEPYGYGSGWRNYGRRGGYSRRGGGGGYGGSSYVADWGGDDQRLNTPRRIDTPYSDDLYSINTSSPIIRRATIRRERFSSQRGRLNQWQ